jgi:tetratricopeptide (TPR) repeat protein
VTTPSSINSVDAEGGAACFRPPLRGDLKAFHDGELPPLRRAVVGRHLRHCATCTAELVDVARISNELKSIAAPVAMPADLRRRVLDKLNDPAASGPTTVPVTAARTRRRRLPMLLIGGGAAAACGAAVVALWAPLMSSVRMHMAGAGTYRPPSVEATEITLARRSSGPIFRTTPGEVDIPENWERLSVDDLPPLPELPTGGARSGRPLGMLVCEPAAEAGVDPADADFAAGCGDWIMWNVGGLPDLDRTPLLPSISRGQAEIRHTHDLRLSAVEARNIAAATGATHVAVGTVRRSSSGVAITYTLLDVRTGAADGGPISVSGDAARIRAALPELSAQLAARLGVRPPILPGVVELSSSELAALGRCAWSDEPRAADLKTISATAGRSGCGMLVNLIANDLPSETRTLRDADLLLTRLAPRNPLAWSEVAYLNPTALSPLAARLDSLRRTYPGSTDLAMADVWLHKVDGTLAGRQAAVLDAVRDSPADPDIWLALGDLMDDLTIQLRSGRDSSQVSPAEWRYLTPAYELSERAYRRATEIDPQHDYAWTPLAEDAAFAGDYGTARTAVTTAESVSRDRALAYGVASEILQPKWHGDPIDLSNAAHRAAAGDYSDVQAAGRLADALSDAGYDDLATQLLNRYRAAIERQIARNPADANAHWNLASVLYFQNRQRESIREYKLVARLLPDNIRAQSACAMAYVDNNQLLSAMPRFEHILQMDPDNLRASVELAGYYHDAHRWSDAERVLRALRRLYPNLGVDRLLLGDCLAVQTPSRPAEALSEYRAASALGYRNADVYAAIADALATLGRTSEAVREAQHGYAIYGSQTDRGGIDVRLALANAYEKAGRASDAAAIGEEAYRIDPTYYGASEVLGDVYCTLGKRHRARIAWKLVAGCPPSQDPDGISHAKAMLAKYPENGT